ncbi:MAG: NADH-quinone oxidoreductase subunit D [Candidatus Bathyarchaeia archaeon]
MWVNMGPQHPMTHGLWDLKVKIDGDIILDAVPMVGYLHRGVEKISENRTYYNFIPVTDRLCYVAAMSWSTIYVSSVEAVMGITPPERAQYIRVICLELQRIASHLMWLAAFAADLGLLTMFLYPMRDRELFLELLEQVAGVRMLYCFPRIGGVKNDLPPGFRDHTLKVCNYFEKRLPEYEQMMDKSEVFLMRTKKLGILPADEAINLGVTGPMLRASGVNFDLRKNDPYLIYDRFDFDIPVGKAGDTYDRYWVRMEEMRQSIRIVRQALDTIPQGKVKLGRLGRTAKGSAFVRMEDPRGEGAMYIVGDGTDKPYRLKIRSPAYVNLSALPRILIGNRVADVPAITGSVDVCLGEIDR